MALHVSVMEVAWSSSSGKPQRYHGLHFHFGGTMLGFWNSTKLGISWKNCLGTIFKQREEFICNHTKYNLCNFVFWSGRLI